MKQRGVSLIEMMMAIAILTLLVTLGLPSFTHFLQNLKIRTAAENFVSGLQLARSEAVRRNATVEFLLTSDEPVVENVDSTSPSDSTSNWVVRLADPVLACEPIPNDPVSCNLRKRFIEGKVGAEATNSPNASFQISSATARVRFNNLGQATQFNTLGEELTGSTPFNFSNSNGGNCAASNGDGSSDGGPMRCLRVILSSGGQIRLCDPAVSGTTDSRRCS